MTVNIKIEDVPPEDLPDLQERLKTAKPIMDVRDLVKEICDLPPDRAKEVLCNMAKKAEGTAAPKSGWEKYILDSINKHM